MKTQSAYKTIIRCLSVAGLSLFIQAFSTAALAANPTVDAVLAIEYDNGVFSAAVLAHGTSPLLLSRILVNNNVEVDADRTNSWF